MFFCILFLLCCGRVFSQGEGTVRSCPGVWINGVCWARSNVDKPGTFVSNPYEYGLLYQWNRKREWYEIPYVETPNWDKSFPEGERWEPANDPCPSGWRVPTVEEFETLKKVVGERGALWKGFEGTKFTDENNGNVIFFPYAGKTTDGYLRSNWVNPKGYYTEGYYWSGTRDLLYPERAWYMCDGGVGNTYTNIGFSIRCVANGEMPECAPVSAHVSADISACDLPYEWEDTTFQKGTETGIYRFQRISTVTGCDSIVYLHLTIQPCNQRCPGVEINGVCWAKSNVDRP
ncbi:MAG: fibrobacter succinogenes major paralogous domain-containing protein, partial [Odoribacter sp.]|nr:fibrobacter succinogenes major paralogous domain-containing protein [Odoribacter sp.]